MKVYKFVFLQQIENSIVERIQSITNPTEKVYKFESHIHKVLMGCDKHKVHGRRGSKIIVCGEQP